MYLYIMAQTELPQTSESANISIVLTVMFGFLVLAIRTLAPPIISYFKTRIENAQKRQIGDSNEDESEMLMARRSHEFITEYGIESLKKQQIKNEESVLLELGELRAKDKLRETEVSMLRSELKDMNGRMDTIRDQLSKNQSELTISQVKMVTFEKEVENLKLKSQIVEKEKDILIKENTEKNKIISDKENEIIALKAKIKMLEEERIELQKKLHACELELKKEKIDDK